MASPELVLGIDLGTTTCCMAVVLDGKPVVIPNRGSTTTPSVVGFAASGKRVVGAAAKRQAITNPEHTLIAMKRLIGRRWESDEVNHTAQAAACKLVEAERGAIGVELRGQTYGLPELSAILLQELRVAAEEHLGQPVTKAVVTVPAYFNDLQRQATRDAGQIAGLEVLRIINEPTAAAIAYGAAKQVAKTIVVYDLGGGTFDISIVKVAPNGVFDVLGTGGDSFLGGEDFDRLILDWLAASFRDETGIDLYQDRMALQRLKDAAETAKRELSAQDQFEISLPFIASPERAQPLHLTRTLTRAEFERMAQPLVDRTLTLCREALATARLDVRQIDDVLMVGGSSRIPMVHRALEALLGKAPCKGVNPDEAVAVGAALHAASLGAAAPAVQLRDVTSHGLGFRLPDNRWKVMIERNAPVPTQRTYNVTTTHPGQRSIRFVVLQGVHDEADRNEPLGEFRISGFRPSDGHHEVDVEVTFALDEQGMVRVRARDVETGAEQSLEITGSNRLTDDAVHALELEALASDVARLCEDVQLGLGETEFARTAVDGAREAVQRAREALASRDPAAIAALHKTLTTRRKMLQALLATRSR